MQLVEGPTAIPVFTSASVALALPIDAPGMSVQSIDAGELWPLLSPHIQNGVVEVILDGGQDDSIRIQSEMIQTMLEFLQKPSPVTDAVEESRLALQELDDILGAVVLSIDTYTIHSVDRGTGEREIIDVVGITLSKGRLKCENPALLRTETATLRLDPEKPTTVPPDLVGRALMKVVYSPERSVRFLFEGGGELTVSLAPDDFKSSEAVVWDAPGSRSIVFLEGQVVRARRFRGDPRDHLPS